MENNDIRWKQRFQNFKRALKHLKDALQIKNSDIIQKAGIIQFFEMSYELGWNTVKDFLEDQGFIDVKSPRTALKKAFEIGLISDRHICMNLSIDRNLTANTYDEAKVTEVERLIHHKYFPMLKQLYDTFKLKENE